MMGRMAREISLINYYYKVKRRRRRLSKKDYSVFLTPIPRFKKYIL